VNAAERELLAEPAAMMVAQETDRHWLRVLLRGQVLLLVLQYFCWSYVWYYFITSLPTFLQEDYGQSLAATAGLAMLPLIAGGLGTLASGWIPAAIPRRAIAVTAFAAVALMLVLLPNAGGAGTAIALMAAISFCGDLTVPISWNSCVEIGRRYTATVSATMNMFGNFAGFVAPFVTGLILERWGNDWSPVLYLMAGVAALGSVLWLFLDVEERPAENGAALAGVQP
jgi:predicted MFS family arabinose efflux permease